MEEVGIPETVVIDNAGEQTGDNTEFVKAYLYKIWQRQTEPYTPKQNWAESAIGKLKKQWCNKMGKKGIPKHLWDCGLTWASEINNQTAHGPSACTPLETITGDTPDISEWLDFDFYNWCWFWHGPSDELTKHRAELGHILGVAHRVGSDLCYWILVGNGKVIAHTVVQWVIKDDMDQPTTKQRIVAYWFSYQRKIGWCWPPLTNASLRPDPRQYYWH